MIKDKKDSRRARNKGYALERECVWYFRNRGIFVVRIPTYNQVGELSVVDVIAFTLPIGSMIQCKITKEYLTSHHKTKLRETCLRYSLQPVLCYKKSKRTKLKRGIKFEIII